MLCLIVVLLSKFAIRKYTITIIIIYLDYSLSIKLTPTNNNNNHQSSQFQGTSLSYLPCVTNIYGNSLHVLQLSLE